MTIETMIPEQEMVTAMENLTDIVNDSGGISDKSYISDIVTWMSDAKGFDVKIVYVCVLNATESRDTLHDFISNGGWNCLSKWLESFILTERHAAIRELLKCFQKLPITHRTLSTKVESKDLPGKMIRGLRKHADEEIKSLAGSIYKSWMDMVDEGSKKKAKRKQEKVDQTQTKKSKSEKSGPVLVNNFMSAAFLTEDQKKNEIKKKKEAKQKKRDEKKRKEENSSVGIKPVNFTGDLSILNTLNTTQTPPNTLTNEDSESLETDRFNTLGRRSPPMHVRESTTGGHNGSSSPPLAAEMLPKRPQKPGAKSVRWTDQTGSKPLEQVREFEVIPDERVNVNHEAYKMKMELEAFKEAESQNDSNLDSVSNLQGLMAKRQWRSPKRTELPEPTKKNIERWSSQSKEKETAAEKTARTLQQIFLKTQIPFSPSEPESNHMDTQARSLEIPRIPLEMRDANQPTETVKAPEPVAPSTALPSGIDFDLLTKINTNDIQAVLQNSGPSPSLPTQGRPNMYDPGHSHSRSPPIEDRFGRQHGPTPPRGPMGGDRKSPLVHDGRFVNRGYQERPYGSRDHGQPYRGPRDNGHPYAPPQRDQYSRDRYGSRDRSPMNDRRQSRSPPRGGGYERRSPQRGGYSRNDRRDRSPPRHQDHRYNRR